MRQQTDGPCFHSDVISGAPTPPNVSRFVSESFSHRYHFLLLMESPILIWIHLHPCMIVTHLIIECYALFSLCYEGLTLQFLLNPAAILFTFTSGASFLSVFWQFQADDLSLIETLAGPIPTFTTFYNFNSDPNLKNNCFLNYLQWSVGLQKLFSETSVSNFG